MIADGSPLPLKRRRLITIDPMEEADKSKAKIAAIKEELGREIRIFEPSTSFVDRPQAQSQSDDETDDFYELCAADYCRISSSKKEDKFLKTKKIREAEEAARRSRISKAVIRVHFPDNCRLEATFHPSETLQSLVDLLKKVIARADFPFHIYTTPPKKLVKDLSQDFYAAGFIPGAIVYFSYDIPRGHVAESENSLPFLREDVLSLKGLDVIPEPAKPDEGAAGPVIAPPPSQIVEERKPAEKKLTKPKWLKM